MKQTYKYFCLNCDWFDHSNYDTSLYTVLSKCPKCGARTDAIKGHFEAEEEEEKENDFISDEDHGDCDEYLGTT
jgi:hypothetical protein